MVTTNWRGCEGGAFSPSCSAGSPSLQRHTRRASCSSSAPSRISPLSKRSRRSLPRLGRRAGSSMPSARSPAPRPCSPICRATPTVSPSRTAAFALNEQSVTFKVKDYRIQGPGRYTTMTLDLGEFIRRFLIHVLPKGFHRIRHYGLFASSNRTETMEAVRKLLNLTPPAAEATSDTDPPQPLAHPCPCCGGRMIIIETFEAGCQPRHRPTTPLAVIRIDTS